MFTSSCSAIARVKKSIAIRLRCVLPQVTASMLATNGVNYATSYEREVLDVLTTIRHHCTLETAGRLLAPNAERYLRSAREMQELFRDLPEAIANAGELSARLTYQMSNLGYRFPDYPFPKTSRCRHSLRSARRKGFAIAIYPSTMTNFWRGRRSRHGANWSSSAKLGLAGYSIVWDMCSSAHAKAIGSGAGRVSQQRNVLCVRHHSHRSGGHGSAVRALSLRGARRVAGHRSDLPSGEQRERAIQYVYQPTANWSSDDRQRDSLSRTSAAREAGKALGFDAETLNRLTRLVSAWEWKDKDETLGRNFNDAGFDIQHRRIAKYVELCGRMQDLPRHLGQHSGGMVICGGKLDGVVPMSRPRCRKHGQ